MSTLQVTLSGPQADEYAPYYGRYTSLVPAGDILRTLEKQQHETVALLSGLSEKHAEYRYAPGKWSIKQTLGHILDTERIFAYRVLRIARNDRTPIEGYEQDDYVRFGPFEQLRLADLLEEFATVRSATLSLLRGLDEQAWLRRGIANNCEISVRAAVYVIAGHEIHHRNVLREKYLSQMPPA
jgi:uncharacterized damage-inducible protein DinB